MSVRALLVGLLAVLVLSVVTTGVAAGRAWGRAEALAEAEADGRERVRGLEDDLVALRRRLDRHAESQRRLADEALDCRVAAEGRHLGKRVALAQVAPR